MSTPLTESITAVLLDRQEALPLSQKLADEDLVLLLTPVAIPANPNSPTTSDPFEPLGKALARVHPWIRHVPYTRDRGITGVHVAFIRRAKVVVFVVTTFAASEGAIQLEIADVVREVCEDRHPIILAACCHLPDQDVSDLGFPTVLQVSDFTVENLETLASALMSSKPELFRSVAMTLPGPLPSMQPSWSTQTWEFNEQELPEIHSLWTECLPNQFHLGLPALSLLLKRDGYAMHHVARDLSNGRIIGFCATYTTFADRSPDRLVGSIAAILVREYYRKHGVGRVLHDEAVGKLNKIRGVCRIQVGSTFPRLLYGPPATAENSKWLEHRGWTLDGSSPGRGRPVADWALRFADHPVPSLASAGLSFRPCQITEIEKVVAMAGRESEKKSRFGWYDQYARTADSHHMEDIILGFEGQNLVAAAITYVPNGDSPCAMDLPWAAAAGQGIGGVTCICVKDDDPDMVNGRNSVITRLLQSCRQSLGERGMVGMLVDGVRSDEGAFTSLGFCKWAEYREVWRTV